MQRQRQKGRWSPLQSSAGAPDGDRYAAYGSRAVLQGGEGYDRHHACGVSSSCHRRTQLQCVQEIRVVWGVSYTRQMR